MAFKIGDIVRLKSGGPAMTVSYVEAGLNMIECTWFGGITGTEIARARIPPDAVQRWEGKIA